MANEEKEISSSTKLNAGTWEFVFQNQTICDVSVTVAIPGSNGKPQTETILCPAQSDTPFSTTSPNIRCRFDANGEPPSILTKENGEVKIA
jgi:hypothetical protein